MRTSRFWSAMEQDGVLATGIDSTKLVHGAPGPRGHRKFESFVLSTAWARGSTISTSYASARVPQAFCAQPMWHHAGCGTFDVLLMFRMTGALYALLRRISLTDRCGADVNTKSPTPDCAVRLRDRACVPMDRDSYERELAAFRKPNKRASRACNDKPLGLCEVTVNVSHPKEGLAQLEAAMLALRERVLCLSEPWTTHLNSELQYQSTGSVASALKEAFVAVAYVWANVKQRGFNASRAHERRRLRALEFSQIAQKVFGLPRLEVWGLALNV
ncbi:hypothetical protein AB1Y20_021498 [Prymnesium parvum]|uniref:Uncharacterized protein n=1 Tax=Prymnesium parvum TaxID=97485 RepID=A0AB34JKR2_PRYPA